MRETGITILFTLCLHAVLIKAKLPDWVPAEVVAMAADDKKRCMAEHGVNQDVIDKVNEGVLPDEQSLKCYMHCMFDAFSMIDEDGSLELEMMLGIMPESLKDRAQEAISPCVHGNGADLCEKVYNIGLCCSKNAPDLWFMV